MVEEEGVWGERRWIRVLGVIREFGVGAGYRLCLRKIYSVVMTRSDIDEGFFILFRFCRRLRLVFF